MTFCVWATILIFPLTIFFCFLNTNMFHTIVCVTRVRIIYVAVTFVLLFFLDFIKKKKKSSCNLHFLPILKSLVWQPKLL
uniref:Uncharacterized protein n=1 Tax=Pan troglodytes TaxID=9598 RepID=A0A2I3TG51_PANTR